MSQDGTWWVPADPEECLSETGCCNACGDSRSELLSDGRCERCHENTNPPHSWCLHPWPR